MCGIAGIISSEKKRVDQTTLHHINNSLYHRGPDGHGLFFFDGKKSQTQKELEAPFASKAFFLHRRLSILDLSESGAQPMSTPDFKYTLLFNGEIYNFTELKEELIKKGYVFKSHSDTEVLLYMLIEEGTKCLKKLRGMFAFAFLDAEKQTVLLARDHFGIKPLFYTKNKNTLAFASEIKALKPFLSESPKINPKMVFRYLTSGITDHTDECIIDAVKALPPRNTLTFSLQDGNMHIEPYYELRTNSVLSAKDLSFDEAAQNVRDLFLKSIELHMRSDVAVGAALSGGIDSSSVVCAVRHLYPKQEIHTFSYIASTPQLNEEKWVDIVTKDARTVTHKVHINQNDLLDDLDDLIATQGEPFGSTSIYAQYRVFKLAQQQGIKVTLDGQGADEFLGGYNHYIPTYFKSLIRNNPLNAALLLFSMLKNNENFSFLKSGHGFVPSILKPYLQNIFYQKSFLNLSYNASLFKDNVPSSSERLKNKLVEDVRYGFLHLLRYADHNSMAASVESRVPFLIPELVEFVLSLPESFIISNTGERKSIFKTAMRGIVPDAILDRTDKIGFETPQNHWVVFLREKGQKLIQTLEQKPQNIFHIEKLKALFNHPNLDTKSAWYIINFLIFAENYNLDLNRDDKDGLLEEVRPDRAVQAA